MKILVAEDDEVSSWLLAETLAGLGHEVVTVRDGGKAWSAFRKTRYDVVISDWRRPHDDKPDEPAGIGLLHELQDHKIQVPVVFYHGKVGQEELANRRKLALSNGAIGTTGSPGELLEMTAGALVQGAMRSEAQP